MYSTPAAGCLRARYLVYFQYLGTDFNGVAAVRGTQRAVGVQNYLEEAAERLNSVVPVKFTISSRTDAGVHALSNAAHLDVQRRSGQPPFSPEVLVEALNTHLRHPAIRVLQAFRVPNDFHARYAATSRTYLYRLATGCPRPDQLPVFERNLCWALQADCLDVTAMQEAAQYLLGTHDFSAFQSAGSPSTSSVRTLRRLTVSSGPTSPFVLPQESRKLRFWSLEFESQSFLYRQEMGIQLAPSGKAKAQETGRPRDSKDFKLETSDQSNWSWLRIKICKDWPACSIPGVANTTYRMDVKERESEQQTPTSSCHGLHPLTTSLAQRPIGGEEPTPAPSAAVGPRRHLPLPQKKRCIHG
ncbi:tRNA pseudouridine synthase-like 1 isoform X4 [Tupaia chinensis]|uniref:tRNA pseudouridine synthase-like 1 isoform X4 n=1 Tax=Tupaia chinensis TaxID=246437 RepID=UPI0003C8DE44|nr:tRNA pseudouridine synthase-like 1 isoform X4 [Tupaia chinensis]